MSTNRWNEDARSEEAQRMRAREAWRKSAATKPGFSRQRRFKHEALAAALGALFPAAKA